MSGSDALRRAFRDIAAARHLLAGCFAGQAVSRAYYASFSAAEAALASLGETRSKHAAVIAAFGELVVKPGGVDREVGRLLRSLFERRSRADYGDDEPSLEDAERAIADAERFVGAVGSWLSAGPTSPA